MWKIARNQDEENMKVCITFNQKEEKNGIEITKQNKKNLIVIVSEVLNVNIEGSDNTI